MRAAPPVIVDVGTDRGRGNLLGVQPVLTPRSYRSRVELAAALDALLTGMQARGAVNERTVVLFPEHIGSFLYLTDEWPWVYRADTVRQAGLRALADEKALLLVRAGLRYQAADRADGLRAEFLRVKAQDVARNVTEVFGSLARQYRATVVAGSVALPGPAVVDGRLTADPKADPRKAMQNVAPVFGPDGLALPSLVAKRRPIPEEARTLWLRAHPGGAQVHDTPLGRVGVLLGSDVLHDDGDAALAGADVLANPSFVPRGGPETATSGTSLRARVAATGASAGLSVFLRGPLWDYATSGQPVAVHEGRAQTVGAEPHQSVIVNLWR